MNLTAEYFKGLSDVQLQRFDALEPLYRDWNSKINVISRKDIDNLYSHHVLHSLAIAKVIEFPAGSTVLDVGTGGGFPGIPLAIMFPQCNFTLCDSIGKKIKVASAVADSLGLDNVKCVNCRVEDLKEKYDFIVSRAVTDLTTFYTWVKGKFRSTIFYLKGGDLESEIADCARKFGVDPAKFYQTNISNWYTDDFYKEKKIVIISQ